jgi:hypothetical protein
MGCADDGWGEWSRPGGTLSCFLCQLEGAGNVWHAAACPTIPDVDEDGAGGDGSAEGLAASADSDGAERSAMGR